MKKPPAAWHKYEVCGRWFDVAVFHVVEDCHGKYVVPWQGGTVCQVACDRWDHTFHASGPVQHLYWHTLDKPWLT